MLLKRQEKRSIMKASANTGLKNRSFILVLIGQIISLFGNAILRFAIPLHLLNETGSAALFGFVSACAFLPMILLTPIGGIIADRVNKRNIMTALDFSTAALVLLFALLLHRINLVLLIAIVMILLYAIQGAYSPAVQASVPALVSGESIIRANALINLVSSLSSLLGPVLGGALFAAVGITPILFISAACFFASAVMELFIRIPFEKRTADRGIFRTGLSDLQDSLQFITKKHPEFIRVCLIIAGINLFMSSCVMIGLPIVITQKLEFTPELANRFYGYSQGAMGAGSLLGGMLAGILASRIPLRHNSVILLLCGITLLPLAIVSAVPLMPEVTYLLVLSACFFMMLLSAFFSIRMMGFLQMVTPPSIMGKVISCVLCFCMCATPIGQALYGILFEKFEADMQWMFLGSFVIITGIALLSVPTYRTLEHSIQPLSSVSSAEIMPDASAKDSLNNSFQQMSEPV